MNDLFLRTKALIGEAAFARLQQAHVAVVGLGGVGGAVLEGLARAGVGRLTLIDPDVCSPSNQNRQLLALCSTQGQPKALVARDRVQQINPQAACTVHCEALSAQNAAALLGKVDFVADCIDDVPAKVALAAYCKEQSIPLLMCMGTGNRLTAEGLKIVNFEKTEQCPLAKKMRVLLRQQGFTKVQCLYSAASPIKVAPLDEGGKRTVGSISFVPPVAGYRMAEYILTALMDGSAHRAIPQ